MRNLTLGALSITVGVYIPWAKAKVVNGVANLLYQANARNYYVTVKSYRKFANISKPLRPIAAEKNVVTFYLDKDKKVKVSTQTNITYTSWYK